MNLKHVGYVLLGAVLGSFVAFPLGGLVVMGSYEFTKRHWGPRPVAAVAQALPSPIATPQPLPPKSTLIAEVFKRQQALAAHTGELEWVKKRTGADCSVGISEEECLPFLNLISTDQVVVDKLQELRAAGVRVSVTKLSAYATQEVSEGRRQAPIGEIAEDGTLVFLYREATIPEVRQFLSQ